MIGWERRSTIPPAAEVAVAFLAGMALLPESVAERYAAPGVRFVPLEGLRPTFATGVVTRRDTEHLPTVTFLDALSKTVRLRPVAAPRPALSIAA
jgi:DNA-binding transcriptional LysR family regulator